MINDAIPSFIFIGIMILGLFLDSGNMIIYGGMLLLWKELYIIRKDHKHGNS